MYDHDSCRRKVCIICLRKATRDKDLSETDIKSIRAYVNPSYNVSDPDYPCGLCNGCYLYLNKKGNGADIVLPIKEFIPDLTPQLRSSLSCNCSICMVARSDFNLSKKLKKKKGRPKQNQEKSTLNILKLCSTCFTEIYQRCRHQCSKNRYRHKKLNNLEELIGSPTTSERLASRTIDKSNEYEGLQTCGPKRKIMHSSPLNAKRKLFSLDDMCVFRKNLDLSTRQTLALAQNLRQASGSRHFIESYAKQTSIMRITSWTSFFIAIKFFSSKKIRRKIRPEIFMSMLLLQMTSKV